MWCWWVCSLANVDPIDVAIAINELKPESTLGTYSTFCCTLSYNLRYGIITGHVAQKKTSKWLETGLDLSVFFINNFLCIGYCPSFSKIGCINVRISENCEKEPSLYKIYCCWKFLAKTLVTLQFINGEQFIVCLGNSLQLDWLRFDTLP